MERKAKPLPQRVLDMAEAGANAHREFRERTNPNEEEEDQEQRAFFIHQSTTSNQNLKNQMSTNTKSQPNEDRAEWSYGRWKSEDPDGLTQMYREDRQSFEALRSASAATQEKTTGTGKAIQLLADRADWSFDRWRREDSTGLELIKKERPNIYEALRSGYAEAKADRTGWDFKRYQREDPKGLLQMQREQPMQYKALTQAYADKLSKK